MDLVSLTGAPLFHTERLLCRRWLPTDLDSLYAVYSDPEGARWVDDGAPITTEECIAWLEVTANNYTGRGYGMFALDERTSGKTLGFCGLVHPGGQPEVELKYAFQRDHWGQGFATEAARALIRFAQTAFTIDSIVATVAPQNHASQRVLGKVGFRFVAEKVDDHGDLTQWYRWTRADQHRKRV